MLTTQMMTQIMAWPMGWSCDRSTVTLPPHFGHQVHQSAPWTQRLCLSSSSSGCSACASGAAAAAECALMQLCSRYVRSSCRHVLAHSRRTCRDWLCKHAWIMQWGFALVSNAAASYCVQGCCFLGICKVHVTCGGAWCSR